MIEAIAELMDENPGLEIRLEHDQDLNGIIFTIRLGINIIEKRYLINEIIAVCDENLVDIHFKYLLEEAVEELKEANKNDNKEI